ncbi:GON-4-like protein isoform X4 [Ochotona princeps]|uniref:GON-4-like protein isoform X4 n=1 Tax=Ochotona princeps TaxID=9978 RepID=UPI00271541AB|nr:GON-4-like protein isoform X4 [Ochotona princeps]
MLPCKKRRTMMTESPQHQGGQKEDAIEMDPAVELQPSPVTDLQSVSLSWGAGHDRAAGLEATCVQIAAAQAGGEQPSGSCRTLSQDAAFAGLEGVGVDLSPGAALHSLESSPVLNAPLGKGKFQSPDSRGGKKTALSSGPAPQEDRGDHLGQEESCSGESNEEGQEAGGKPQMLSGEVLPSLLSGIQAVKPVVQPRKSSPPDVCTSPQEKPIRTVAPQAEEETEDGGLFIPMEQDNGEIEKKRKKKKGTKRKRDGKDQEEGTSTYDLKLDDMLDRTLEDGAKQHNLTAVNVRNILHEVITNEHVVAMMKAAISETEDMPMFEPKMTRSKLKEVVEKGVVIPTWNISPIKKANEIKPPQFVDIQLEEDDSSDEEYQPDDEEEDETAEESLLESDVESTASSPRGAKKTRLRQAPEMAETDEESGPLSEQAEKVTTPAIRHISAEVVPMGPPPPPKPKQTKDSAFMEKLHAVDEELASSPVCMDSFQSMDDSLIAFRTRSKMPLKDVPLGQLEAELRAPDITPDMYDPNTADDEDWKVWLGGLMNDDVGNEDEADDDDDPEYNFLEDLDEPDTEDFRTDRAVRITKKEVEELFETFQDEMGFSNMEDDGPEEEEHVAEPRPNFNTPQALRFEEPLANLLNEQHRTVKELLEQLKMKKSSAKQPQEVERAKPRPEKVPQTLILDAAQRKRLQHQMQQHVQLLTQIHLLATSNVSLSSEANTTKIFLKELGVFAQSSIALHQPLNPTFHTLFQPCNLMGAMQLIDDFSTHVSIDCSPRKIVKKPASEFPCLPKQVAWILATSKVFMYPELLPVCSLKAKNPTHKVTFTKAEDNLLALGLKHFEGTEFPKPLISKYLLPCKSAHQLTVRIKNLSMNRAPDNIIKFYKKTKQLPVLLKCCEEIQPHQWKPPVEREEHRLPFWLKASLPSIQEELRRMAGGAREEAHVTGTPEISAEQGVDKGGAEMGRETQYPLLLPKGVVLNLKPVANKFSRKAWRQKRSSVLKPLLIRPSPSLQPSLNLGKTPARSTQSEAPPSKMFRIPQLIQPAIGTPSIPGESVKAAAAKSRSSHRARSKRGSRARASKDTSKLLLLYDEDILERDPLREQKDLAFAQAYLTRVREALQHFPGKYEDFLQVIYEFETNTQRQTAVDLYKSLQLLLQDWPQLLRDFAAFLLPEQALACGLFEEQQAFEKSRKFLRQLEICFAENPSHHQKIIKVLQGCADCLPQEIAELKTQMWQLLKGHDHLQDEFSIFFDHLRPAASRMGDFEEINWTEEKEYEFDGFEEVALPDVEEEEEPSKIPTASKSKRRKEMGAQNHDKETEWPDGAKDCTCSCHEGGPDSKLKKSKRRNCCHCSSKVCDSKSCKSKEPQELVGSSPQRAASPGPGAKEAGRGKDVMDEEASEEHASPEANQSRPGRPTRKAEVPVPCLAAGSTLAYPCEATVPERLLDVPRPGSPEIPQIPPKTGTGLVTIGSNHAGPEGLPCPSAPSRPQKDKHQEVEGAEASTPLWDTSKTEKSSGTGEPAASFPSPVSSRTRDVRRRQVSAKVEAPESQPHSSGGSTEAADRTPPAPASSSGMDTTETSPKTSKGALLKDAGLPGRGPEGEHPLKATEATVCANNSKVSSTGEKVVLWTREADRVILTMCQEQGAQPQTFSIISQQLGNKTPAEVSHRFRELMQLFHTACEGSSEDEDDATSTSNADQLSDHGDLLSEEELDE